MEIVCRVSKGILNSPVASELLLTDARLSCDTCPFLSSVLTTSGTVGFNMDVGEREFERRDGVELRFSKSGGLRAGSEAIESLLTADLNPKN